MALIEREFAMCIIKALAWIKCLTKCPEKLFTKFTQLLLKYNPLPATKFFQGDN